MAIQPQAFLNFAGRNYALLHDIYRREHGVNEAELFELIRKYRIDPNPSPEYTYNQLLDLKILEPLPDATAIYEMTRPVSVLFRFLLQEQRYTSAKVIQAHLDDLDVYHKNLEDALRTGKLGRVERSLYEIDDIVERVRQDSRANLQATINEVMALKSNRDRQTVRERFGKILFIWEEYLKPLQDLIDVKKSMDSCLDRLEALLQSGGLDYHDNDVVYHQLSRSSIRLVRLRREVLSNFRESIQEVEPLYRALERDSILARGASIALERVDKSGLGSLELNEKLALPGGRLLEGLFANGVVESYLHGIQTYEPKQAPSLSAITEDASPNYIDPQRVAEHLDQELPVEDVLGWLLKNYQDCELAGLLRVYGRIIHSPQYTSGFSKEKKTYHFNGVGLTAYPLTIEQQS
jgi:hypothetical protein